MADTFRLIQVLARPQAVAQLVRLERQAYHQPGAQACCVLSRSPPCNVRASGPGSHAMYLLS
jgi:hypothetical protein